MQAQKGSRGKVLLFFFTSALVGGWMVNDTATLPFPTGKESSYPFYRRIEGPKADLDGNRKSRIYRVSNPGLSNPEQVAIPTDLSRLTHK